MHLPSFDLPSLNTKRASEDDFMRDLVQVGNVVCIYLDLVARLPLPNEADGQVRAVLVGHMVRLYKLYDSFLYVIVGHRAEVAMILQRCIFDTIINLLYLVESDDRQSLVQSYVRSGLAYEKRLLDNISQHKQNPPIPIEERMLRSIKATFDRASVDPEQVNWNDRHWGGSILQKAEQVGLRPLYEFAFRVTSGQVHGTWHDLEFNHLTQVGDDYKPDASYRRPQPQHLEAPSVCCLETAIAYIDALNIMETDHIKVNLREIIGWFQAMIELHEEWLLA